jgi:5-methyltetrahydrofolate--homocysteine methyltransferase
MAMLGKIIEGRWLTASGVVGLWRAHAIGDDIEVLDERGGVALTWRIFASRTRARRASRTSALRISSRPRIAGEPIISAGSRLPPGLGIERKLAEFERAKDDYNAIMLKALADRLAEAFAEWLHAKVRRELWGYERDHAPGAALDVAR